MPVSYTHLDVYKRQAHDGMDLSAIVMELLQHGIRNGAANAAAHNGDLLLALGLGGLAQRSHEVCQACLLYTSRCV